MREGTPRAAAALLVALSLGACNSTDTLDPAAIRAERQNTTLSALAPQSTDAAATATTSETIGAPVAALPPGTDVRLQVAPVVGASVEAAGPLGKRLVQRAAERGLAMSGTADPAAYLLKGYFSAISEGKETIVIFVWDVVAPAGNRLHRIQGQERVAATATDAWSAVPASTMEAIADRTVEQLVGWLATRQG